MKGERYIYRRAGQTGFVNLFAGILVDHAKVRMDVNTNKSTGERYYTSGAGYTINLQYLERVVCKEKLQDSFITTRLVELEADSPALAAVTKDIARIQGEMIDTDSIQLLIPVLRTLRARQKELQQRGNKIVREEIDSGLIRSLLTSADNADARLRLREILRETVKVVRITSSNNFGGNWFILVKGEIETTEGKVVPFSYAYASRHRGYIMAEKLGDNEKARLAKLPTRKDAA